MTTTGSVLSDDGVRIAFSKVGSGPALLLVDGALCFRDNGPSQRIASLLASHFTIYAYDRRGRGESGDSQAYSIAREIADLRAVIRQAGDSVFVLGSSSGAVLAMQAAAGGLAIRKLVLYEPPIGVTRPGGPTLDEAKRKIDSLAQRGNSTEAARYFLSAVLGTPAPLVRLMPLLMHGTWTRVKSAAPTLPYDLAILTDRSLEAERAKAVRVPTLVVGGANSPDYMRKAVVRVAESLPHARAVILPGQSHDVAKAAEAMIPTILEFFRSAETVK